jgi:hypothetical protein
VRLVEDRGHDVDLARVELRAERGQLVVIEVVVDRERLQG